jgi:hypothetical protein
MKVSIPSAVVGAVATLLVCVVVFLFLFEDRYEYKRPSVEEATGAQLRALANLSENDRKSIDAMLDRRKSDRDVSVLVSAYARSDFALIVWASSSDKPDIRKVCAASFIEFMRLSDAELRKKADERVALPNFRLFEIRKKILSVAHANPELFPPSMLSEPNQ